MDEMLIKDQDGDYPSEAVTPRVLVDVAKEMVKKAMLCDDPEQAEYLLKHSDLLVDRAFAGPIN